MFQWNARIWLSEGSEKDLNFWMEWVKNVRDFSAKDTGMHGVQNSEKYGSPLYWLDWRMPSHQYHCHCDCQEVWNIIPSVSIQQEIYIRNKLILWV